MSLRRGRAGIRRLSGSLLLVLAPLSLLLLGSGSAGAAPVRVRFAEGVAHGFLAVHSTKGQLLASGDLLQVAKGGEVESHIAFHFKDGSLLEESVVFTQDHVFALRSYHIVEHGPTFPEDMDARLERDGKYHVVSRSHKDGKEKTDDGRLSGMPDDTYSGMLLTVVKDLEGRPATVHVVVFTPKPRVIEVELAPADREKVTIATAPKQAVHYFFKPHLHGFLKLFAKLTGKTPADDQGWFLTQPVPAFLRFEGQLVSNGPVWRIDLATPKLPG